MRSHGVPNFPDPSSDGRHRAQPRVWARSGLSGVSSPPSGSARSSCRAGARRRRPRRRRRRATSARRSSGRSASASTACRTSPTRREDAPAGAVLPRRRVSRRSRLQPSVAGVQAGPGRRAVAGHSGTAADRARSVRARTLRCRTSTCDSRARLGFARREHDLRPKGRARSHRRVRRLGGTGLPAAGLAGRDTRDATGSRSGCTTSGVTAGTPCTRSSGRWWQSG